MKRWSVMASVLALGLSACATEVGEGSSTLEVVTTSDYAGQLLYMDLAVSPKPLTAAELGDAQYATPVEVVFYDEWAVAWYAPEGVALDDRIENAIAAWSIEAVEPIDGDVRPGDEPGTTARPRASVEITTVEAGVADPIGGINVFDESPARARIDWLLDRIRDIRELPPGFHPGCF